MLPCTCDVGECYHMSNCRHHRAYATPIDNQGTTMARDNEPQRSKADRIERLRKRLDGHVELPQLRDVLKGILDLLADEL